MSVFSRAVLVFCFAVSLFFVAGCQSGGAAKESGTSSLAEKMLRSVNPDALEAAKHDDLETIEVNGQSITYAYYLPSLYDGTNPFPLVVFIPAAGEPADLQRAYMQLDAAAEANQFIVAYPQSAGSDTQTTAMVSELLSRLSSELKLDRRRVFVVGFASAASSVYNLALALPGNFAGIAAVSGGMDDDLRNLMQSGIAVTPIPIFAAYSTDDVSFRSGDIDLWRAVNGCSFTRGDAADGECTGGTVPISVQRVSGSGEANWPPEMPQRLWDFFSPLSLGQFVPVVPAGTDASDPGENEEGQIPDDQTISDDGTTEVPPEGVPEGAAPPNDFVPPSTVYNPARYSNGHGGPLGEISVNFASTNGRSSTYRMNVPSDIGPNRPYGLFVYLHGDYALSYNNEYNGFRGPALQQGLILLMMKAPGPHVWPISPSWWYPSSKGEGTAKFLHEVIQSIFRKYNIDTTQVYFSGKSGGSEFLATWFIPHYGAFYNSGALLLCGGATYYPSYLNDIPLETRQTFRMYYYISRTDKLYSSVSRGINNYQQLGMSYLYAEIPRSGSHCAYPEGGIAAVTNRIGFIVHDR